MPTPLNRSKLLPARGSKANLEASLADLLEGEFCYATDENVYYQVAGGFLVPVNQGGTGQMSVMTSDVMTDDGAAVRAGRELVPPDLPPGYTELINQREVNWWIHREVENVANRTTVLEGSQRQQDERIYALEQASPEVPEGPVGDVTKEYVDAQDAALDERLKVVEFDYTTTDELNAVNDRVTRNTGEIQDLQAVIPEAFVGEAALPESPYPGQQWMNPDTLTVMVFWQGIWVPCAPPVHSDGGVSIPSLPLLP